MSVVLEAGTIRLRGSSAVEDAEVLLELLLAGGPTPVDLQAATGLHAAVLQVLLTVRPDVIGPASDPFVDRWLLPLLKSDRSTTQD